MAQPLLSDDLWEVVEPLLPAPGKRRFRYPGRKPVEPRRALTGILFVLKTGIQWEDLPLEMGWGDWPVPGDDSAIAVTVDLPFAYAACVVRHRVTGAYDDHSIDGPAVRVVAEPPPEGWVTEGRLAIPALPPGQVEIHVFEGIADG